MDAGLFLGARAGRGKPRRGINERDRADFKAYFGEGEADFTVAGGERQRP